MGSMMQRWSSEVYFPVTLEMPEQPEKAVVAGMEVKDSGRSMAVRLEQFWKVSLPMEVSPSGRSIAVRLEQFWKV